MKTLPDFDLNWIQDGDGLGMLALERQAELKQAASTNRSEHAEPSTQNHRAERILQAASNFAMALRCGIVPA